MKQLMLWLFPITATVVMGILTWLTFHVGEEQRRGKRIRLPWEKDNDDK